MTAAEARQIDQLEFKQESRRAINRALKHAADKRADERQRMLNVDLGLDEPDALPVIPSPKKMKAKVITVDNQSLTISEWAKQLQISVPTIRYRAAAMGSYQAAIKHGGKQHARLHVDRITVDGETRSRSEWASHLGILYATLCQRISKHGVERAIAMGGPRSTACHRKAPGVAFDSTPSEGTGGGSTVEESTEITFSKKAKSA